MLHFIVSFAFVSQLRFSAISVALFFFYFYVARECIVRSVCISACLFNVYACVSDVERVLLCGDRFDCV